MAIGLVSYEVPSLTEPSGRVIWIGLRSRSEGRGFEAQYQSHVLEHAKKAVLTSVFCVFPGFDSIEHFESVIDEIWLGIDLYKQ